MNKFIGNLKVDSSGVLQGAYSISEIKSIDPSAYDSSLGEGWGMGSTQKMLIYDPFSNVTEIVAHIIIPKITQDYFRRLYKRRLRDSHKFSACNEICFCGIKAIISI